MKKTAKYKEIICESFAEVVPTLAKHMKKSDDRLENADDPMMLRLGWKLPSGTRVLLFIGKFKEHTCSCPHKEKAILQLAMSSDAGRENFAAALFSTARKQRNFK